MTLQQQAYKGASDYVSHFDSEYQERSEEDFLAGVEFMAKLVRAELKGNLYHNMKCFVNPYQRGITQIKCTCGLSDKLAQLDEVANNQNQEL